MRKTREVLRLYFDLKLGQRQIARSANLSQSTVHDYLERFRAADFSWPLPAEMSEAELERRLFAADAVSARPTSKALPDFTRIREELRRHRHTHHTLLGQTRVLGDAGWAAGNLARHHGGPHTQIGHER